MGLDPDAPPPSWDRRRLLFALGAGAVNLVALHQIEIPSGSDHRTVAGSPPAGPTLRPVEPVERPGDLRSLPTEHAPAMPGAGQPPEGTHVHDLVISGGRVIDPDSGFDGLADVGIDGDRIVSIAPGPLLGRTSVIASGQVVAPGFIDLLSAEPNPFGVWLKLADGVTTNLAMHGVNNYASAFFDRYGGQTPIHFGGAFHHHFMRGITMEVPIEQALGPGELERLADLVTVNLDGGFAGVSFSPEYSPGTSTDEMVHLCRLAASRGHAAFFHVRHSDPTPPGTGLEAIDEVVAIVETTGVSAHIEHLTSTGGTFAMEEALTKIEDARGRGLDITACLYPYDFWGTFLASNRFAPGWQERYGLVEADLQIAGTTTRLSPDTIGPAVAANKLVAALGSIPEPEIELALQRPWTMVASDAIPTIGANNHPRGAGTFARTVGRYVRQRGTLDLMAALAKITILPAQRMQTMIPAMASKGRLQRGADADVVVFDPAIIDDRATVATPAEPSVGISHVVVAGQLALVDGQVDRSVLAGRALPSGP